MIITKIFVMLVNVKAYFKVMLFRVVHISTSNKITNRPTVLLYNESKLFEVRALYKIYHITVRDKNLS